ncbi:hypothetical protein BST81_26815 [Leptolyngbya sp. 'hensonii']|uniref:nucleotidyltransferase family protein n=1 Tax=Leptolyngbya sp. 'hensonii' TaxID=1922337 RepID=UPI00094FEA60|nr:nucleotidyltransferase domain-containing protein [Leptolyngbya sp. 'hensonii']OLP15361.1 hypothetical protein BST81_26815 [Leptolyngbya sp. 'hensonii']
MGKFSADAMQRYILTAKQREQQTLQRRQDRQAQAMMIASTAAQLLRDLFGASRVVVFGSLVSDRFNEASDIDLAVWDLPESRYFQAVGKLQGLSELAIDLVRVETASADLLGAIGQGTEL